MPKIIPFATPEFTCQNFTNQEGTKDRENIKQNKRIPLQTKQKKTILMSNDKS